MQRRQSRIVPRIDNMKTRVKENLQMMGAVLRRIMQRIVAAFIERDPVCMSREQFFRGVYMCYEQWRASEIVRRFDERMML